MSTACGSGRTTRMLEAAEAACNPGLTIVVFCGKSPTLKKWLDSLTEKKPNGFWRFYGVRDVFESHGMKIELWYKMCPKYNWVMESIPGYDRQSTKYFIDHDMLDQRVAQLCDKIDLIRQEINRIRNYIRY